MTADAAGGARRGVALVNLGCRVNRVELDLMASELERSGVEVVPERDAGVIVVNTCAVTGEAEAKTRKAVRRAATLPQAPVVVATGCVANLFSNELEKIAPNVIVEREKRQVAARVLSELGLSGACGEPEVAVSARTPTGRTRPGIKIQDGCDNRCTYCIVWKARGAARSLPADEVVSAVRAARLRGAREVVLTGINLGSYRYRELDLPRLLNLLLERTDVERIRLSSIEPPDVTPELCSVMAGAGERVAPFLHICLQSGCDETLRRMARVYRTDLFRRVVETAREHLPHISLGTDLIVGFPGETDEQFRESLDFCKEMRFAKMHVFRYSRRPGTPAASMPDQVEPHVSAERSRRARALADEMRLAEARALVGEKDLVVVQYPGRGVTGGLFDALVDPSIPVDSLVPVVLTGVDDNATFATRQLP
ncbi:MiaB/RimO family radical SAM methylthiotransferase [Thermophilibacter provencensis]|uniref:MiaB/RimO family radical SAM methylthiotransferase n=1 Tax=Thermophilibacter provencensis TaxID=1852386 RepID=A0ABT7V5T3_9ACTN|nr:MiaB/RimO family radical SAM methylthiotransferase [Thermophilibacter provencensis]MDM8271962.1 MiaB/RimO family radical SAM methylthiotransferase [Thermophilibacter provencensis]